MRFNPGLIFLLFFCTYSYLAGAQSLPVGQSVLDDLYRRKQLLGQVDSSISFTVRPLTPDSTWVNDDNLSIASRAIRNTQFRLLPVSWIQQYNTHHPYGWNNGPIVPAKGYQTMVTAGFFARYGPLTIQIKPEFVFAENLPFKQFQFHYGATDLPERFGTTSYTKFFWGQSSIRLNAGPVSFGLSSENLWWGPGIRNSLLMSNSAPGFKHLTLNTIKPIKTYIGSFEGQVVAGRLEESGFTTGLSGDWRYLSAMVISYHPKWIPSLFLGLTRSFQQYHIEDRGFGDYFPLFQPFQKINTNEDNKRRDQLTSLFARWVFPRAKAELYLEYGLNDHSYNIRDFIMSPEHSRAYIWGFRKMIPFKGRNNEYVLFSFEGTHLEQSIDRLVRGAGEWYTHFQILEGYTNNGEVLGAGIGPGGNLQSFDISWFKGLKHLGLQLERYEHNGDFYDAYFSGNPGGRWIDLSAAAISEWTHKSFLFNAKLQAIQSLNYQWNSGENGLPKENVFNFQAQLGITYRF